MTIEKPHLKQHSYTLTIEGVDYIVKLNEPEFKQIASAFSALITASGTLDLVGSGKVIFETCAWECDKAVSENARVLVGLCMRLSSDFVTPADAEIKKN